MDVSDKTERELAIALNSNEGAKEIVKSIEQAGGGGGGQDLTPYFKKDGSVAATGSLNLGGFNIDNVAQLSHPTGIKITTTSVSTNPSSRHNIDIEPAPRDSAGFHGGHINLKSGYGGSTSGNVNISGASVNFYEVFWGYQLAQINAGDNHEGIFSLYESTGKKISFATPTSLAANLTFVLPAADGAAGQLLKTNGAGVLSWADPNIVDYDYQSISEAGTYAFATKSVAIFDLAGPITAFQVDLPATPTAGQIVRMSANNTITALTVNGGANTVVNGGSFSLLGSSLSFLFVEQNTTWVLI